MNPHRDTEGLVISTQCWGRLEQRVVMSTQEATNRVSRPHIAWSSNKLHAPEFSAFQAVTVPTKIRLSESNTCIQDVLNDLPFLNLGGEENLKVRRKHW